MGRAKGQKETKIMLVADWCRKTSWWGVGGQLSLARGVHLPLQPVPYPGRLSLRPTKNRGIAYSSLNAHTPSEPAQAPPACKELLMEPMQCHFLRKRSQVPCRFTYFYRPITVLLHHLCPSALNLKNCFKLQYGDRRRCANSAVEAFA